MKYVLGGFSFLLLSGCTLLPITEETGGVTISFFQKTIECEIAAVAADPKYKDFHLSGWLVKNGLDMTIVDTLNADGKGTVPLANPTLPTIFPFASFNGKYTHTGHVDFATSIKQALKTYGQSCKGPDPSETHLGLAAWIAATLDTVDPFDHGGLSYTVDVDVTASAGSRFGFVFSIVNMVDAGLGYSREGQHHLTISLSQPTPPPPSVISVRVVNPVHVVDGKPSRRLLP